MKTQPRFYTIFSLALMAVLLATLAGPAGTAPALARDLQPAEKQVLEQEGLFAGSIPTENFEGLNSTDWGQIQELIAASFPPEQAYLKASNTGTGDEFGYSVAIFGDTVVVSAYREDSNASGVNGDGSNNTSADSGAVYVFVRDAGTWSQQAYLKAATNGGIDHFGRAVAINGDTIVVGAHQEASSATGVGGDASNNSVSNSGAAYVFVRNGSTWSQQAYLKASNTGAGDRFGTSVAVFGDTIVVGAHLEDSNAIGVGGDESDNSAADSGAAYVFTRNGTFWSQQAYLKASNTDAGDRFGYSVAIDGETIVVGAYGEGSNATGVGGDESDNSIPGAGAVYVFLCNGPTWSQQAYLKASNTDAGDQFGRSVAISNNTLVVGANGESSNATGINGDETDNSVFSAGAAYVFLRLGSLWIPQAYLKASNAGEGDQFGYSVAISDHNLVVGAVLEGGSATGMNGDEADNSAPSAGAAYLFTRSGTWTQQAYLKASNTGADDRFGNSVAIFGDTVVIGSPREDSNATGIDGDGSDNSLNDPGAAYVFIAPPSGFGKSAPFNGATEQPLSPTLSWQTSTGAASYEHCIDTSNNNTCNTSWISVDDETSASVSGLAGNTTYYWQVRAVNAVGDTEANSGEWWSFTTDSTVIPSLVMSDYDGDGISDPAKFYPSSGVLWWQASSTSSWENTWLGNDTYDLVSGSDYDGDGKADPAKFVSSIGTLWYIQSSDSTWNGEFLGVDEYEFVGRSDFDGDGKTDPAKFVSSIGALWYIESSNGLWQGVYLGPDSFEYLAGNDFDGDGKSDPAKYVPSMGVLWYYRSTDSTWQGVYLGVGDYDYISGNDYDGDGKSDPTVFYASTGTVWWQNSSTGVWDGVWMGSGTFTFVGGHDFDGDGKTDLAKFDPVTGQLSWLSSSDASWYMFDLGTDGYDLAN